MYTTGNNSLPIEIFTLQKQNALNNYISPLLKSTERMKRIFVCSPFAGETEEETAANVEYAIKCCKFVFSNDAIPVCCASDYIHEFSTIMTHWTTIRHTCRYYVHVHCDEVWSFLPDNREPTDGMRLELTIARRQDIPIIHKYIQ